MWGRTEVETYLKQRACEKDGDDVLMFYKELYDLVGIRNPEDIGARSYVHNILGDISKDEGLAGRPLLSVIVVNQTEYSPGQGFYNLARECLPDEYSGRSDEYIFKAELDRVKASKNNYCV